MTPIETSVFGLNGLALAWESVAALLVALAIGLVAGFAVRRRTDKARKGAAESRERLGHQSALLRAAQVLSGELELDTVLQRLADELAGLLQADAADCYLYDEQRNVLRCAAVHGLDDSLIGFEFPADVGLAGQAIREGRPLAAVDYAQLPAQVPHQAYDGFTNVIVAPMRWSDEVHGVLGVGRRGRRPFDASESDALEAFAGLASLALRNAETFTQSTRQARVQRGFYRIASVLGQSLSRAATLDAVAQAAAEAIGAVSSAVLMPHGDRLTLAGSYDLPEAFAEMLGDGIGAESASLGRAAAQGRMIAAPLLADDDRLPEELRSVATASGFRSLLSVPVEAPRHEGGGLVVVFFAEARAFSDDDLELARHLADATRGALERSELFEAERSARALAQQLTRTGRLLTTELDPAAVLDEVVQQAPELVHADACAIRVLEDDELVVSAAEGRGADEALGTRSPANAWLSGDVVQSRSPVALENAGADPRLRELDPMLSGGNAAYLGVPLAGPEGAPLGVLAVYAAEPRPWREEEVEAMLALAASASAALVERRAVSARRAREGTELRDPGEHRRRDRRRRPRGRGRAVERRRREDHGCACGGRARAHARSGAPAHARVGDGHTAGRSPGADHARPRGGAALGDGGGDARSRRGRRRPDLRVPRHLRRPARRADEVGLRLDGLARVAHAAHVDLRLRRDAAAS